MEELHSQVELKGFISDERYKECARIRATFIPKEPVWIQQDAEYWHADFGDYLAGTFIKRWDEHFTWYYVVNKKIINELFGVGEMLITYGDEPTLEAAKITSTRIVQEDRTKRENDIIFYK